MLVQLADITFGYAGEELFSGLSWQVNAAERIGLVGPNGSGKSTLLRLMAGRLQPESGQVARARGATIGYLQQSQEYEGRGTLLDALLAPFAEVLAMREELQALSHRLDEPAAMERYGHLEETYRQRGGYALEARVRELAADVGFAEAELGREVDTLSGGERNRLELAKVLLAGPDLLRLDEPTNHLDTPAVERLEGFLKGYPGAFVIVSHDRYFLDATVQKIVEIDDGDLDEYVGGWSTYVAEREKRRELQLAALKRQREEIERTEDFIRRNIAGQKTNQAKSRRKMLAKLERLEWHRDVWQHAGRIGLRFEVGDRPGGKEVLKAESLSVGFGEQALLADLDVTIYRGDRVGIVGPNGAGKTTLLKTLLGKLPPVEGSVRRGHEIKIGVFDQKLSELDDSRSLVDEIRAVRADLSPDAVRNYLARFRFFGDDVFRVIRGLSGGERNRMTLAKMMLRPANVLALDEPTNHLDIPAREVLERALKTYEGTILVVSHDRFFLDEVVTRLLVLEGNRVEEETGNYSDWKRRRAAAARRPAAEPARKKEKEASAGKTSYVEEKARKAEREKLERRFAALEAEIADLEAKLAAVRTRLADEHGGDWQKLHGLVEEERQLDQKLKSRLGEWEKLGERLGI